MAASKLDRPANVPRNLVFYALYFFVGLCVTPAFFFLACGKKAPPPPPPPPPLPVNLTYRPDGVGGVTVVVVNTGSASLTGVRVVVAGGHGVVVGGGGEVAGRVEHAIRELSGVGEVKVGAAELGGWALRPGESIWVIKDGFSPVKGVVPLFGTAAEQAALARPHISVSVEHHSALVGPLTLRQEYVVIKNMMSCPLFAVKVRVTAPKGGGVAEFVEARLDAHGSIKVGRKQMSRDPYTGDRVQVWLGEAELLTYTVP